MARSTRLKSRFNWGCYGVKA